MGLLHKMLRVMIHTLQAFENAETACQTPGVTVRQSFLIPQHRLVDPLNSIIKEILLELHI